MVGRWARRQGGALLFVIELQSRHESASAKARATLRRPSPWQSVVCFGQQCFCPPNSCASATSALTLRSRGCPKGCAFRSPLTSHVRALTLRIRRQHFRATAHAPRPVFRPAQMQSELRFALFERSVGEPRFALLFKSGHGLRFAQLNSQKVGAPPWRRSPLRHTTAPTPRINRCEGTCRSPASQFFAGSSYASPHNAPVHQIRALRPPAP